MVDRVEEKIHRKCKHGGSENFLVFFRRRITC